MPAHRGPFLGEAEDVPSASEDDLSAEQIHDLLKEAENRMRAKNTSAQKSRDSSESHFTLPKLNTGVIAKPYIRREGDVARVDSSRLLDQQDRGLSNDIRKVEDPLQVKKRLAEENKATAGSSWFNLPRTDLTSELKRDLQLLKMRGILDPKRFYKKENGKSNVPEFSQVGTIIEGPTEYYNGRLQNKDRKKTFVEEVLAGEAQTGRFKKKYSEIQSSKTSGKKAYYKALKAKRKGRVEKG